MVTPLDPERLRVVLTPDALAAFEHTLGRKRAPRWRGPGLSLRTVAVA